MFGEVKFFIGLQVNQLNKDIFITQPKYIKEILNNFGMDGSRKLEKPMVIEHKFSKNDDSVEVDQTFSRTMIGKIQYVVYSRCEIAFSIAIIARLSTIPKENHMMEVKRVLR